MEDAIKLLLSGKLLEDKGNTEGYVTAGIKSPRQVQSGVKRTSCLLTLMFPYTHTQAQGFVTVEATAYFYKGCDFIVPQGYTHLP